MRELSELPFYRGEIEEAVMENLQENRFGAAADIVRQTVVYVMGGMYLDIDCSLETFDLIWYKYFDAVFGATEIDTLQIVNTVWYAAAPNHAVQRKYLSLYLES